MVVNFSANKTDTDILKRIKFWKHTVEIWHARESALLSRKYLWAHLEKQTDVLSKRLMRFCPLLFGWKLVPWHSWVWCVQLSGGNVGGEMVQKEEEGGRKGTVWCGDFWKEFFHPCVTSSYRKGRVNVTEWLPEGCVFCSQVFVLCPLPRRREPQITGTGGDTPSKGWTDSGCGWWLLKVRVTLTGRVWSLLVAGSSKWVR